MSGNDNNNINNGNLSKKEQENVSAQKAGQTGARVAADALTSGSYEKVRNAPVVGNVAKKAEDKIGKKIGNIDKKTGGSLGKIAKPLNDSGAIDTANKGMNVMGGKMPNINKATSSKPGSMPNTNKATSSKPGSMSNSNNNNNLQNNNGNPTGQNFARNGLNNKEPVGDPNGENASKNRLRDIFNRKKGLKESLLPSSNDSKSKSLLDPNRNKDKNNKGKPGDAVVNVAYEGVKKLIKTTVIPFTFGLVIFMFITLFLLLSAADKSDVSAVDEKNKGGSGNSASYYSTGDPKQIEFYERVIKIKNEYKEKGKEINSIYIAATYHVLNRYDKVDYSDMDNSTIKDMADGMLDNSTVYSIENYKSYLKEKLLPKHFSESKYEKIEDMGYKDEENNNCVSSSGGTCGYSFNGIVNGSENAVNKPFSVSNLKVRLMNSTDKLCNGPNNEPMYDELVDFEDYVLGVMYGEIGTSMHPEVQKAHSIAARSFSLARGIEMNGGGGVKYTKEGNQDILQMRPCVADHLFCNTKTGCSANGTVQYTYNGTQHGNQLYADTNHAKLWKNPLSHEGTNTLKQSWQETLGVVGVDADNRVVEMSYWIGNGNKDDNVWQKWAEQGAGYEQIILQAYPKVRKLKKASCNETTETSNNSFLKVARDLWKQVTDGSYTYTNGNKIPPDGFHIDCSTYVDWVLYEYGFDDFKGHQKVTQWFVTTDLHAKYGWTEIHVNPGEDVTNKLRPGDILVRDPGNNNGHMNIIAEIKDDGTVWGYDCGSTSNWTSSRGGKLYNVSSFVKGDAWGGGRPGKIIRVNNSGTGGACETAASGEWSSWRQNGDAPWKNISLGNSNRTIGSHGCYITSIAIQIARSGVKTNLNNFNPGTLVTELNKNSNSFDGYGSLTGSGQSNITSIVPGFKIENNYIDLSKSKENQISTIKKYIDQGYYVLLHLDNGKHWVAVTGVTNDNIQMIDPGRNDKYVYNAYPVSSCVGITLLSIK